MTTEKVLTVAAGVLVAGLVLYYLQTFPFVAQARAGFSGQ
jgi:hypothetical protein